jgi:hypothetical protein
MGHLGHQKMIYLLHFIAVTLVSAQWPARSKKCSPVEIDITKTPTDTLLALLTYEPSRLEF